MVNYTNYYNISYIFIIVIIKRDEAEKTIKELLLEKF